MSHACPLALRWHETPVLIAAALGAPLQNVLTAIKSDTNRFPTLELSFSTSQPLQTPIVVALPSNGFRLRFDASTQRLRLIELVDIARAGPNFAYKGDQLLAPISTTSDALGLVYRRVYQLFGPSYPGEYIPSTTAAGHGFYILSFDGIAFTFPLAASSYHADMDHAHMLSSSAGPVHSIAIFDASSWPLFTSAPDHREHITESTTTSEPSADYPAASNFDSASVNLAEEKVTLTNRQGRCTSLYLGQTTAQDLITDLGPPDAIFNRPGHIVDPPSLALETPDRRRSSSGFVVHRPSHGSAPSSFSSTNTDTYDVDFDQDSAMDGPDVVRVQEQYYCYFRHGIDILIGPSPTATSHLPTTSTANRIVLHGNIPGSYSFNSHQRIQWSVDDLKMTSESAFSSVHDLLLAKFKGIWPDKDMAAAMVIVRDWAADSPGGSAILIDNDSAEDEDGEDADRWLKNTRLYKFPGLMAEVMHNDSISALTLYASQSSPD